MTPGLESNQINVMSKVINADAQRFSSECADTWEKDSSKATSGRLGHAVEGPGDSLGMDKLIQCQLDAFAQAGNHDGCCEAVVDRNTWAQRTLDGLWKITIVTGCVSIFGTKLNIWNQKHDLRKLSDLSHCFPVLTRLYVS